MNQKKASATIFFTATVLFLAVCGILLFALPQRTYSENENRYLTTFQPLSISAFLDTSMQKNLTDSADDQFIGRDLWVKFATALQHTAGFRDIGGVYLGKDGYYFERILDSHLSASRYQNNLRYLEQFANIYCSTVTFLPVPSKGTILKEYLPLNAVLYHADSLYEQAAMQLKKADLLDIRPSFLKETDHCQLYFKTDHHWTTYAAYLAYEAFCLLHNDTAIPLSQFSPECVRKDFYGTLYSKAPDFCTQPDLLYLPCAIPETDVSINKKKSEGIYDWGKLQSKDKYGVYFGGNFGQITIHNESSSNGKALLIIKDSFANSLVPYLIDSYETILLVDFRYYNKPLSRLIEKTQPDETLILYEISNFAQDTNFFKILK